ncbi:MAG TPA: hypothetical protein VN772_06575, partial [Solirubrobacteraceae bacterium]|nr:hypothetical protein [Solirubrobacteraceae bacterium]
RPRRVSGPARPARGVRERPRRAAAQGRRPLVLALPAALDTLAGHRLLGRLIAGKAWIAVVAFALIGIVTLQLALLQLNTSIGRALVREGNLQRENAALSIENSEMAAGDRVESRAAQLGMELVPAGALRFLTAHPRSDAAHAAGALSATVQPSGTGGERPAAGAEAQTGAGTSSQSAAAGTEPAATTPPAPAAGESSAAPAGQTAAGAGESSSSSTSPSGAAHAETGAAATPAAGGAATTEASPAGGTQPGPAG